MTCRHKPGDPRCSSSKEYWLNAEPPVTTPDKNKFQILEILEFGKNLLLKVKYPNCLNCAYEGTKVLLYTDVKLRDVIFWKEIDPHFADPKIKRRADQAPPPFARFPANDLGWKVACELAQRLNV